MFPNNPGIRVGIFPIPQFPAPRHCQPLVSWDLNLTTLLLQGFWQSREFSLQAVDGTPVASRVGFPGWEQLHHFLVWNSLGISRGFSVIFLSTWILCFYSKGNPGLQCLHIERVDCAAHTLPKYWLFQEFSGNFDLKY